jgi:hypothetical protein
MGHHVGGCSADAEGYPDDLRLDVVRVLAVRKRIGNA